MRTDEYYDRFFPYSLMELFLEPPVLYDQRPYDPYRRARRELAFGFVKSQQLSNDPAATSSQVIVSSKVPSEGLLRYQSFGAQDGKPLSQLFRERMEQNRNTTRIDIGPVYALTPPMARKHPAGVEFRELIFDVDIFPDYNPFRRCRCIEPNIQNPTYICTSCWPYLCAAMHALDFLLQTRFGFHECMWLFSGRRGVHCWVLDPSAGLLNEASRRQIATLLRSLSRPSEIPPLQWVEQQPDFKYLYERILKPRFDRMMAAGQINLSHADTINIIGSALSSLAERRDYLRVMAQLERNPEYSGIAWDQLQTLMKEVNLPPLVDLVFYVLFPKIDYNVVPSPKHLLRCPMSVHTGSFGVVVPLMLSEVDSMDPQVLPNLRRPASLENFQRWTSRFEQYLWSRHPLANQLVCLHCFAKAPNILSLSHQMLFDTDVEAWRKHHQFHHARHGAPPPPQQSTLRTLIHKKSAGPDGITNWAQKYSLFTKLRERI